jgi:hypothetical protein
MFTPLKTLRASGFRGLLALVALVGVLCAFPSQPARAADSTVTYNSDDLFLGFRQTAGSTDANDYLIDLGPIQDSGTNSLHPVSIQSLTGDFTHNYTFVSTGSTGYGSVGTDLQSTFGTAWYTAEDPATHQTAVLFSLEAAVAGTAVGTDPKDTLYTTIASGNAPYDNAASSQQAAGSTSVENLGTNGYASQHSTANTDWGVADVPGTTSTYGSYQGTGSKNTNTPGGSFNYFSQANEGQTTDTLTFERIVATTNVAGAGTSELGTFGLDANGDLVFKALSVPEPSTWASLLAGSGFLLLLRRRTPLRPEREV